MQGEVARPGKYPLGTDMTAADLVRLSGGLKRSAYSQQTDLTRYWSRREIELRGEDTSTSPRFGSGRRAGY
jgi:protein involved in polysaccharide export with SLBB domain